MEAEQEIMGYVVEHDQLPLWPWRTGRNPCADVSRQTLKYYGVDFFLKSNQCMNKSLRDMGKFPHYQTNQTTAFIIVRPTCARVVFPLHLVPIVSNSDSSKSTIAVKSWTVPGIIFLNAVPVKPGFLISHWAAFYSLKWAFFLSVYRNTDVRLVVL